MIKKEVKGFGCYQSN